MMAQSFRAILLFFILSVFVFPSYAQEEASGVEAATDKQSAVDEPLPERLLRELKHRQDELERQERELAERERSVAEREAALDERLAEIQEIRSEIESAIISADQRIAEWEAREGDRIKRLAKIYAEMPAARAAPLLEQLDLDLATHIVSKMKQKESAAVVSLMNDKRAVQLSKRVARPINPIEDPKARGGAQ